MGGMIGEMLAVRHPYWVRSLTLTLHHRCPRVGQPAPSTMLRMGRRHEDGRGAHLR